MIPHSIAPLLFCLVQRLVGCFQQIGPVLGKLPQNANEHHQHSRPRAQYIEDVAHYECQSSEFVTGDRTWDCTLLRKNSVAFNLPTPAALLVDDQHRILFHVVGHDIVRALGRQHDSE